MIWKLSVADMTIHRIVELETPFMAAREMLPGLTAEILDENRAWLQPHSLGADDVFRLCIQSYIVETPHHTILVDTCLGNHKPRARPEWSMRTDETYLRTLNAAGFALEDIDYVMCTHMHLDHVGWNTRLQDGRWVPTFPNARYVFSRAEHDYWQAVNAKDGNPVYLDSVLPVVEAGRAELVADDYQLGDHMRILPTPGHTAGHVAFCFGQAADEAVMAGDLIHVPLQTRYPELSFVRDQDMAKAAATRRAFLERYCDTGTLCCVAHFPSPSVGRVTRWGDGFRCEGVDSDG
jgi:glyoxylase-like metal-dependent hydrolase (beta-lactamase superfamily II)